MINKEQKKIIKCECGGTYSKYHKQRHIRTRKHQNYMNDYIKNYQYY